MRICQIVASHGDGGLEKHVRELCQQLVVEGHDVTVLGHPDFLITLDTKIKRYAIPTQLSRRHPWLLWIVFRYLRSTSFDVIHAQANKAAAILAMLRFGLATPTVGTLHNMKRCLNAFHHLNHTITVSHFLSTSFEEDAVTVVYNGIKMPTIQSVDLRARFQLPIEPPTICAVGRLVEAKGFDLLLDAVSGLHVNVLIVGEGPERDRLQQQIDNMPEQTHCCLVGHQNDVPELLAASDAVVISSRREGFSYVFNEAVLTGAKILATDVPVANEMLPAELIVPIADSAALRVKLRACLNQMAEWDDKMLPIRAKAREELTLSSMTIQTLAVYQRVYAEQAA